MPTKGTVFVSVANRDKRFVIFPVKRLVDLGFEILATAGTASMLRRHGVVVTTVRKFSQGAGPDGEKTIVQAILDGQVDLIFNTPHGLSPDGRPRFDGYEIRTAAVLRNIPCVTTVQGLAAAVQGIEAIMAGQYRRPVAAVLGGYRAASCREIIDPGYPHLLRPLLFRAYGGDAERVHERTLAALDQPAAAGSPQRH